MQKYQKITDKLHIKFDKNPMKDSYMLPTFDFCVRKVTSIFSNGKHWIYADAVSWSNPNWPNTYGTSIHAFSSPDCREWTWHGEVVPRGEPGQWDHGTVATPGAVVHSGKIYIFYNGQQYPNGKGPRVAGMAIADNPEGPFKKNPRPVITSTGHLDDFCPIESSDKKGINLYFREALHDQPEPNYYINLSSSEDGGKSWSLPTQIIRANKVIRAYETAEVKYVDGLVLMSCFEHFTATGDVKTGLMLSKDGINFTPCINHYLDDHLLYGWPIPKCLFQWCLIPDEDDFYRHIGITQPMDETGHYNLNIYPICPMPF